MWQPVRTEETTNGDVMSGLELYERVGGRKVVGKGDPAYFS